MKVTPFATLLFFVCLNLSLWLLNQAQVLPNYQQSPFEEPAGMTTQLIHLDLSAANLLIGGTILGVGAIIGYITGHLIYGGTIAIILFALDLLFPILKWLLFGFPIFLGQILGGTAGTIITTLIEVLMAVVWFWFILGYLSARTLES